MVFRRCFAESGCICFENQYLNGKVVIIFVLKAEMLNGREMGHAVPEKKVENVVVHSSIS